jgi:hypothetical protein
MDAVLPAFGPWSPACTDPAERKAQLRQLAALVHVFSGRVLDPWPVIEALRFAEDGESQFLDGARAKFDAMPALIQRRIISAFAALDVPVAAVTRARKLREARVATNSHSQAALAEGSS